MRAPLAVHLDIRPRLTFPTEPTARVRRRWRLPPLALPAVGYWLAMGALTYGFMQLGPHPLDEAFAMPEAAMAPPPAAPRRESEATPAEPPPVEAPPLAAVEPADEAWAEANRQAPAEPEPATSSTPVTENELDYEREPRARSNAGSRAGLWAPSAEPREEPPARREEPAPRLAFPEFTDSSRPERPERAADGPRIDSVFDRADERPSPDAKPSAPPPPEQAPDAPTVVSSCEAAIARNNEQLNIGGPRGAADITREAYASILQNGRYLAGCSIPERTVFEICAAVKDGRAVGITIASSPPSPELNRCVRKAVARLQFPQNSRLDVTHTRFDALKH